MEQADNVLREKLLGGIMKEELFLNEVEINLDPERSDDIAEISASVHYEHATTVLTGEESDRNFIKDNLIILEAGKLSDGLTQGRYYLINKLTNQ